MWLAAPRNPRRKMRKIASQAAACTERRILPWLSIIYSFKRESSARASFVRMQTENPIAKRGAAGTGRKKYSHRNTATLCVGDKIQVSIAPLCKSLMMRTSYHVQECKAGCSLPFLAR